MSREFFRFQPTNVPSDASDMPKYLTDTFVQVKAVLDLLRDGHLDVTYVAPTKPSQGDIRYADGTSWNPGSGEGIYYFNSAGSWIQL